MEEQKVDERVSFSIFFYFFLFFSIFCWRNYCWYCPSPIHPPSFATLHTFFSNPGPLLLQGSIFFFFIIVDRLCGICCPLTEANFLPELLMQRSMRQLFRFQFFFKFFDLLLAFGMVEFLAQLPYFVLFLLFRFSFP